jgi:CMP/dCMP kinase
MTAGAAPVITVDGPSGSGKGTLAERLAERLGWHYLDSGALYRIIALAALERGLSTGAEGPLAGLVGRLDIRFRPPAAHGRHGGRPAAVLLDGQDRSSDIRAEPVSAAASRVAALPAVRTSVLELQRRFRRPPGLVTDGRDMGTVVFPDAELKIFLDAAPEERAKRRYNQLKDKGLGVSLAALLDSIRERDARDTARAASPLAAAPDAVVIDSTSMPIEDVVQSVWQLAVARGLAGSE